MPEASPPPPFAVVVRHISKQRNIGEIVRTAAAFGAAEVICVGGRKQDVGLFGSHGTARRCPVRFVPHARELLSHLHLSSAGSASPGPAGPASCPSDETVGKEGQPDSEAPRPEGGPPEGRRYEVVGIEITPEAVAVDSAEFTARVAAARRNGTRVAFLPGNEGLGLTAADRAVCDWYCYIPHYSGATASLNVNAATAIVLHRFASAAGYDEAARDGEKYVVEEPTEHADYGDATVKALREQKAQERTATNAEEEAGVADDIADMFDAGPAESP